MKEKLLIKLDDRPLSTFWRKHIEKGCGITYQTFISQLNGVSTMRGDVKREIQDFISAK